jgi:hypothetical protein
VLEVGGVGIDGELHDAGGKVVHVELVDDLVAVRIVGGADIDDLPVEAAGELAEDLEGDVEGEGVQDLGRVVPHDDVVDVHLSHLAPFSTYKYTPAKSH